MSTAAAESPSPDQLPQIVLGIPGAWASRTELVQAVPAATDGRYLLAGAMLFDAEKKLHVEVEVREHDERVARAFQIASGGHIAPAEMQAIAAHTHVVYLIGRGGSPDAAELMCDMASAILASGGIAVKIESSGIAHSKEKWLQPLGPDPLRAVSLFNRFVVFIGTREKTYSCGMQALGLRDGMIPKPLGDDAVRELRVFLIYALNPPKPLSDGDTIGPSEDMGAIRLRLTECDTQPAGDLFHNPYGMMRLEPR